MPPPRYGLVEQFLAEETPPRRARPVSRDPVSGDELYLPQGWGGPSQADFDADEAPIIAERNSVRSQLRGTVFDDDDPAAGFDAETDQVKRGRQKQGTVRKWVDRIFSPPEFLQKWAQKNVESLQPAADRGDKVAAFLQGAHEGAIGLMNPFDVVTTAASVGPAARALRGAGTIAKAIPRTADAAQAGVGIARGTTNVAEGVEEGNYGKVGQGVFETAMGGLGAYSGINEMLAPGRARRQAEANRESYAEHKGRMADASAEQGRDFDEFNRWRNDPEGVMAAREEANRLANALRDGPPKQARRPAADPIEEFLQLEGVDPALPAGDPPGANPVDDFLVDPSVPVEGELAGPRQLGARQEQKQLPEGEIARFLAGEEGISEQGPVVPPARRLERGSLITPPPPAERTPFTGTALQASLEAPNLTDGELRSAYIDAARTGDTNSLARLDAELTKRAPAADLDSMLADPGQPSPEAQAPTTMAQMLEPDAAMPVSELPATAGPRAEVVGASPENIAAAANTDVVIAFQPQDVAQIQLDPKTYQFKTSDARGRTGRLDGVEEYDPTAPPITVHRLPDGRLFVADGHQRFNKYLELAQKGNNGQPMPALKATIVDGPVESVMRGASLRNVQEGSAEPLDIARLVRNGGDLTPGEMARTPNLSKVKLRQGQNLGKLGDDAFNQVLNGAAKPEHAAFVGQHITDPAQQATIVQQLGAANLENATQAEAFVKSMRDAGFEQVETMDLFGNKIEAVSLAKPKAQLVDSVMRSLGEQRSAFRGALANAKRLEEAGNVLAGAENARLADEAGQLRSYFEALYDKTGTATNAALREAAAAVHNGQPVGDARAAILDALRRDLETGNYGAAASSVGKRPGGSGTGQVIPAAGPDGGPVGAPNDGRVAPGQLPKPSGQVQPDAPVIDQTAAGPQPRLPGDVGAVRDLEIATPAETLPQQSLTLTAPRTEVAPKQGSLVDAPNVSAVHPAVPKKARGVLEEHLGKDNKTAVREVMDDIVARHPKDPAAQLAAAEEWIGKNPIVSGSKPTPKPVDDTPWNDIADGGQERTVEGKSGKYHEVRFAERPPVEAREALMGEGYKYDFRDKTWRKVQGAPASSVPDGPVTSSGAQSGAAPPASELPAKTSARRVRAPRGVRLPRELRAQAKKDIAALPEGTDPKLAGYLETGDAAAGVKWIADAKKKASGTDLASGFAGLEQLFRKDPQTAYLLARMATFSVIGGMNHDEDPLLGFLAGAATGAMLSKRFVRAGARLGAKLADQVQSTPWSAAKAAAAGSAPKKLPQLRANPAPDGEEMSRWQYLRRPEGAVPKHFENFSEGYGNIEDFLAGKPLPKATRDLHGNVSDDPFQTIRDLDPNDPRARTLASGVFFKDALSSLRKDLKAAEKAKQPRRASYLRMLERAVLEEPAHAHKLLGDMFGVGAHKIQKIDNTLTNHAYRILLGLAADTAVINRTQPGWNVKNVPFKYVAEGMKQGATKAGKAATEFAKVHRPMEVEHGITDGKVLAKLDEYLSSFMASSDTMNRRDSFLAARQYAVDQGVSPAQAEKWAKGAMRQTQGEPGPAGKHPFLREMGPLRAFQNYPHMWAELIADTIVLRKDNPEGFRRMVGLLGGGLAFGAVSGVNTWNLLFPKFGVSTGAYKTSLDLAHHALDVAGRVTNKATFGKVGPFVTPTDHSIGEDIIGGDGKVGVAMPRYPVKVYDEVKHFLGYGRDKETGEHITRDPKGRERSRHTGFEGLLSLAGFESTRQAKEKSDTSEAYRLTAESKRTSTMARRGVQRDLADAIDAGDHKRVSKLLEGMSGRQRRDMRRAVEQTKWQRMRQAVPKRDRAEFDKQFGDRVKSKAQ